MDGGENYTNRNVRSTQTQNDKGQEVGGRGVGGGICNKGKMIHRAQFKEQT